MNNSEKLFEIDKEHEYLVCVDSDGCVFDAMEIKHKECFIPNTVNEWGLQAISKYVRETAEFVNLYSKWRGTNRFPALVKVFELLDDRDEVKQRGYKKPELTALKKWINEEQNLGNPALEKAIREIDDPVLKRALNWSRAVNETITKIVRGVPYFSYVRESFEKLIKTADAVIVSATPHEAIEREWTEHDLIKYIKAVAGQELGSKKRCIEIAREGRYDSEKVLMVGDAIGDMQAAKANGVLFYPINPGNEDKSWKRFHEEALDMFFSGQYKGKYENALIAEFEAYLPDKPRWEKERT
ncbi:MAG: HAD family hydrolase [Clostridiales bacterium]|nr:HAD family hydrolase [Clostridiales bacterium]